MKIDSSSLSTSLPSVGGQQVRAEKSAPVSSTSVSLSDTSSKLQALEAEALQSSGFDAARVAAVKQAIREGKFQINTQLIADKLIETARDLLKQ
jgi:negative regulator of flagellin synthesis FlgM